MNDAQEETNKQLADDSVADQAEPQGRRRKTVVEAKAGSATTKGKAIQTATAKETKTEKTKTKTSVAGVRRGKSKLPTDELPGSGAEDTPVAVRVGESESVEAAESESGELSTAPEGTTAATTVVQPQTELNADLDGAKTVAKVPNTALVLNISQAVLSRLLERVATATDQTRKASPALKKIMIQASQETQEVTITGYNQKVGLRCTTSADVSQSGEFLVSADLGMLVGRMPDVKLYLDSDQEPGWLLVSYLGGEYREPIQPTDDYPELPELESNETDGSSSAYVVSGIDLSRGLKAVAFAVSPDELSPYHCVRLQLWRSETEDKDGLCVTGCSKGTAAIYTVVDAEHDLNYSDNTLLLPVAAVATVERTFGMTSNVQCIRDREGRIACFRAQLVLPNESNESVAQVQAIVRLKEGADYPNIRAALVEQDSEAVNSSATVDYQRFGLVLSRHEAIKAEYVRLEIHFDGVNMKTYALDKRSRLEEEIGGDTKRAAKIILPLSRLVGLMKGVESEQIRMWMDSEINGGPDDGYEKRATFELVNTPLIVLVSRAVVAANTDQQNKDRGGRKGKGAKRGRS